MKILLFIIVSISFSFSKRIYNSENKDLSFKVDSIKVDPINFKEKEITIDLFKIEDYSNFIVRNDEYLKINIPIDHKKTKVIKNQINELKTYKKDTVNVYQQSQTFNDSICVKWKKIIGLLKTKKCKEWKVK